MKLNEVKEDVKTAGFVIATISSNGKDRIHGIIEGYAGRTRDPTVMRACTSMQYYGNPGTPENGVYMPRSSFTMPVAKGES